METKVYRRYVSVIKVHRDSEFLGYYAGRDKDNKVQYDKRLLNAMVIKTAKGVEHILHILSTYYSSENNLLRLTEKKHSPPYIMMNMMKLIPRKSTHIIQ